MVRLNVAKLLKQRGVTPYRLAKATGMSLTTAYKLAAPDGRFERLEARTIDMLCEFLNCQPGDFISYRKGA
jgi:DNA-binding Xre family transcriptional regulator